MEAWARGVVERLSELGVDVQPRAVDEGATQRVRLVRPGAPVDAPCASLALTMDAGHVEVALLLPADELRGARERLADPERALELRAALEALPEQFAVGTSGDGPRTPASRASTDEVRALLDRVERDGQPLWLGWSVPRAVAVAHAARQARARPHGREAAEAPSLDEQLEDAMVALGLPFAMLTSSPDDEAAGARPLRRDRHDRPRRDEERDGSPSAAAARGAHAAGGKGGKGRGRGRSRERDRDREPLGASSRVHPPEAEADGESEGEREPAARLPRPLALLRAGSRRRPMLTSRPAASVDKGARVRVLDGPFSGKVGVVQELDGKGGARVMLGLLAVRIDVKDLADCAEGRDRPRLSSSHRKPLPVRS